MPWHNPPKVADAYKKAWPWTNEDSFYNWRKRANDIKTEQVQEHRPCTDEFPAQHTSESDQRS